MSGFPYFVNLCDVPSYCTDIIGAGSSIIRLMGVFIIILLFFLTAPRRT